MKNTVSRKMKKWNNIFNIMKNGEVKDETKIMLVVNLIREVKSNLVILNTLYKEDRKIEKFIDEMYNFEEVKRMIIHFDVDNAIIQEEKNATIINNLINEFRIKLENKSRWW